jgi:hypothetical protein
LKRSGYFIGVDISGNDWKGNRKDFSYLEGVIEEMASIQL